MCLLESSRINCRLDFHEDFVVEVSLHKLVQVNFSKSSGFRSTLAEFCAVRVLLYNYYVSETMWTLQITIETVTVSMSFPHAVVCGLAAFTCLLQEVM